MPLKNLKSKAMEAGMKFMQSDKGQKIMSNPDVQKAMSKAFQTAFKVKQGVDGAKKNLAKRMSVATEDDLKNLKRTLDRLERKVKKMDKTDK
ncbi:MAG: hypothetical protein KC561_05625 [Myxococcales bacterium]|nr:hypothetical protein [Myxococcales bacterium]